MATMFYDDDADIQLIRRKKVAVIGYGSQGHAHALNLKDSGVDVAVGLPSTSTSVAKARSAGVRVLGIAEASKWADVIMVLVPDQHQAKVYTADIKQHLTAGKMLMFAHGFAVRFNWIVPPADVDVTMVAPKAPGHRVREVYEEGGGTRSEERRVGKRVGGGVGVWFLATSLAGPRGGGGGAGGGAEGPGAPGARGL